MRRHGGRRAEPDLALRHGRHHMTRTRHTLAARGATESDREERWVCPGPGHAARAVPDRVAAGGAHRHRRGGGLGVCVLIEHGAGADLRRRRAAHGDAGPAVLGPQRLVRPDHRRHRRRRAGHRRRGPARRLGRCRRRWSSASACSAGSCSGLGPNLNVQVSLSALLVFTSTDPNVYGWTRLWETLVGGGGHRRTVAVPLPAGRREAVPPRAATRLRPAEPAPGGGGGAGRGRSAQPRGARGAARRGAAHPDQRPGPPRTGSRRPAVRSATTRCDGATSGRWRRWRSPRPARSRPPAGSG